VKKYAEAKGYYQDASDIKPSDQYPKDQIAKIDKFLGDLKAKDDAYNQLISTADSELGLKNYLEAKDLYYEASDIKANEQYPKDKIAEIDAALEANRAKQDRLNGEYLKKIDIADESFDSEDYNTARMYYESASKVKPKEEYPKLQIAEIDRLIKAKASQKIANQNKYDQAVSDGDELFIAKDYDGALAKYKLANKIFPSEPYPRDRISDIEEMQSQAKANEKAYKSAVSQGDFFFQDRKYVQARMQYNKALRLKSDATYPSQQLAAIDKKLAEREKRLSASSSSSSSSSASSGISDVEKKKREVALSEEKRDATFLSTLAQKYPTGVTVEEYKEKNRVVTRIIVSDGSIANEYKKIKYNWGGLYFFKNNESTTQGVFDVEAKQ